MLLGCLVQSSTPHLVRNQVNAFLPINRKQKDFSILTVSEEQIHLHLPSPTQITGLPQDSNPSNNRDSYLNSLGRVQDAGRLWSGQAVRKRRALPSWFLVSNGTLNSTFLSPPGKNLATVITLLVRHKTSTLYGLERIFYNY